MYIELYRTNIILFIYFYKNFQYLYVRNMGKLYKWELII